MRDNKKRKNKFIFIVVVVLLVSIIGIKLSTDIEKLLYPIEYSKYVERFSKEYNIDKYLIYSIIKTESKFNENAVSRKEAKGLMQITDQTAAWANEDLKIKNMDIFDPKTNINVGTWYLKRLEKEFKGDKTLMIAAYNGGSGNVRKWLRNKMYSKDGKTLYNIPFRETSGYTEKVLKNYDKYYEIYEAKKEK